MNGTSAAVQIISDRLAGGVFKTCVATAKLAPSICSRIESIGIDSAVATRSISPEVIEKGRGSSVDEGTTPSLTGGEELSAAVAIFRSATFSVATSGTFLDKVSARSHSSEGF